MKLDKKIKVKFKSTMENPEYRYGDLNKSHWIPYEGTGEILTFLDSENYIRCVVKTSDNKLHSFNLDELEVLK